MEAIDIGIEPININLNVDKPTNFGAGIELLMNEKNKSSSSNTTIDLGELDKLESDLNNLSTIELNNSNFNPSPLKLSTEPIEMPQPNIVKETIDPLKVSFESDSKVGSSTVDSIGKTNTWDGFMKFNDVPSAGEPIPTLNDRERKRKKRQMLKSISEWETKGWIKDSSRLSIESSFDDIEDEYETALEDKRKRDSVKIQQNWMLTMINTIEYGNSMFDPFGVSLDGWGEAVGEDIDSYNEIFEELHEKYKGGKMSPELSLLLRLGFSASVVHFSNKALSTAAPGFNDVIRQSPELMRMFTNATVDSMKQQSPGMAFAEELLNTKPNSSPGPPPAPVETRAQAPPTRPGAMHFTEAPGNRPDLRAASSTMFKEGGVDMNSQGEARPVRPEMKGPRTDNIDDILSGLKTKPDTKNIEMNIHEKKNDEDSIVSVSSLKDLDNNTMPKKSKRRNRSDKVVVSLDI